MISYTVKIFFDFQEVLSHKIYRTKLSLRAGDQGFLPATLNVVPGYFHRKLEENKIEEKGLAV